MRIYDEILSKYFLADEYYQLLIMEAEYYREDLLYGGYARSTYSELGLEVMGANIEDLAIRAVEITGIISRLKEKIDRKKQTLSDALQHISIRQRLLLFTYFQTGVILTTRRELYRAKEHLVNAIESRKEKDDIKMRRKYKEEAALQMYQMFYEKQPTVEVIAHE